MGDSEWDALRYAFGQEARKDALDWPTLVVVGVAAVCASVESPLGILDFTAKKLIELVFPLAGVIIALALPAAQLSLEMIKQAQQLSARILSGPGLSEKRAQLVESMAETARARLRPAWRAVVYALVSFLLAVMGALGLFSKNCPLMANFIATTSLGFLVASAIWFFPTVRYGFRLHVFDDTIIAARMLATTTQQGAAAGPPAPTSQGGGQQAGNNPPTTSSSSPPSTS